MDRCDECGFAYDALSEARIADAVLMVAAQYRPRLGGGAVRTRPSPDRWAPVEYAAHVRDVLEVQRERIAMALRFDQPVLASMEPDRRAVEHRYLDQDPLRVAEQLEGAAASLASLLTELSEADWTRRAIYNWPHSAARDVAWIGRHTVHELAHHLLDISRSIDPAVGPASG